MNLFKSRYALMHADSDIIRWMIIWSNHHNFCDSPNKQLDHSLVIHLNGIIGTFNNNEMYIDTIYLLDFLHVFLKR